MFDRAEEEPKNGSDPWRTTREELLRIVVSVFAPWREESIH